MAREVVKYMDKVHPEWEYVYHVPKDPIFGRGRGWIKKDVINAEMDSGII